MTTPTPTSPLTTLIKEMREASEKATPGLEDWNTEAPASEEWKANKANNAAFIRIANPENIRRVLDACEEMEACLHQVATMKHSTALVDEKGNVGYAHVIIAHQVLAKHFREESK